MEFYNPFFFNWHLIWWDFQYMGLLWIFDVVFFFFSLVGVDLFFSIDMSIHTIEWYFIPWVIFSFDIATSCKCKSSISGKVCSGHLKNDWFNVLNLYITCVEVYWYLVRIICKRTFIWIFFKRFNFKLELELARERTLSILIWGRSMKN